MIPAALCSEVERQPGNVFRTDPAAVDEALGALGIPLDSEFGEFFRKYVITFFCSSVSDEELCDLLEPTAEISLGTRFIHEVWGLPDRFVCLTSLQGEGAYLYDRITGEIFDFDLAHRDAFVAGHREPISKGFHDFMMWYLTGS